MRRLFLISLLAVVGCGSGGGGDGDAGDDDGTSDGNPNDPDGNPGNDGPGGPDAPVGPGPSIGGCPLLPADHLFNTPIDGLPVHPNSAAFITTIGATRRIHLDMGTQTNQSAADFYGIPFNLVDGGSFSWPTVAFASTDPDMSWNPRPEADCAVGAGH